MSQKLYHGGNSFKAIGEDFSTIQKMKTIVSADVLDAWFDPSPNAIAKVQEYLPYLLRMSPPTHGAGLIKTISDVRGISEKNVAIGAGSSGLMFVLFPYLLKNQDTALILDPTYSEYNHIFTNVLSVNVKKYVLQKENNFIIELDRLAKQITDENPKVVVLVNPNSPTGQFWDSENISHLAERFPRTIFVVDETYIEYVGKEYSLEKNACTCENLIILKSMSKVYALSGVRAGYLVAHENHINVLKPLMPPWVVSTAGQVAAIEALKDEPYYLQKYKETHRLREDLKGKLNNLPGLKAYESVGNYFLVELENLEAGFVCEEMAKNGVFLRQFNSIGEESGNKYIRIAVRNKDENELIYQGLQKLATKTQ